MSKEETFRLVDDSCLFCGLHGDIGGGHLFVGKQDKDGNFRSKTGWLCIPYLSMCEVQICPKCVEKHTLQEGKLIE